MTSTTNGVVYINYSTTAKLNKQADILTALIECLTVLLEYIDILIIMAVYSTQMGRFGLDYTTV